jgi:hypothetical protein
LPLGEPRPARRAASLGPGQVPRLVLVWCRRARGAVESRRVGARMRPAVPERAAGPRRPAQLVRCLVLAWARWSP